VLLGTLAPRFGLRPALPLFALDYRPRGFANFAEAMEEHGASECIAHLAPEMVIVRPPPSRS
jgi:hypothetical protein